jgi:ADP-ribose pyrophosphatase YjhB (NUDIX family)
MRQVQPCAGGIVLDDERRLAVVRRANPPSAGSWSVPGGRCLPGEPPEQACVREVAEETGLSVEVVRHAGHVSRDAPDGSTYRIDDYVCRVVGGELTAGDDASDVRWVTRAQLTELELAPGLYEALDGWGVLPD